MVDFGTPDPFGAFLEGQLLREQRDRTNAEFELDQEIRRDDLARRRRRDPLEEGLLRENIQAARTENVVNAATALDRIEQAGQDTELNSRRLDALGIEIETGFLRLEALPDQIRRTAERETKELQRLDGELSALADQNSEQARELRRRAAEAKIRLDTATAAYRDRLPAPSSSDDDNPFDPTQAFGTPTVPEPTAQTPAAALNTFSDLLNIERTLTPSEVGAVADRVAELAQESGTSNGAQAAFEMLGRINENQQFRDQIPTEVLDQLRGIAQSDPFFEQDHNNDGDRNNTGFVTPHRGIHTPGLAPVF